MQVKCKNFKTTDKYKIILVVRTTRDLNSDEQEKAFFLVIGVLSPCACDIWLTVKYLFMIFDWLSHSGMTGSARTGKDSTLVFALL